MSSKKKKPATPAAQPATAGGPFTGETEVVVAGRPLADANKAARDAKPRRVGAPHHPLTGKVELPPVTEAQLAAGPPRPEPAKQVRHDPGTGFQDTDSPIDLDAPIKWLKVRATRDGFTGVGAAGARRRAGDVFQVDERFFSKSWMEVVPKGTPEKLKTGQDVIDEEHDARIGGKVRRTTSDHDVIADS